VDPLVGDFPMLTPYQFASNRPIDGIDLDGLEYVSSDECLIYFVNGVLVVRYENLSKLYRASLNNYNLAHKLPIDQYLEYLGSFEFKEEVADATNMKTTTYDQQKTTLSEQKAYTSVSTPFLGRVKN